MKVSVSIVIPTYHRRNCLLKLLKSISTNVRLHSSEVIIVEQGNNNRKAVTIQAKNLGIPIRYYYLSGRSITHSLNEAVRHAKGEYVLILDDELTVDENLIKSHISNFDDRHIGITVGRIITVGQANKESDSGTGKIDWLSRVSGGYSSAVRQEIDSAIAVNMCWRKKLLKKIGGFDERYTGNAMRFETDASVMVKNLGYKIIFEPSAKVVHHKIEKGGTRKSEGRIQWYFDLFSNETYFFLKYFPKFLLPLFLITQIEWMLRCMFGFGREISFRSIKTPLVGIVDGIKKYHDYRR